METGRKIQTGSPPNQPLLLKKLLEFSPVSKGVSILRSCNFPSIRHCLRLLGKTVATFKMVPFQVLPEEYSVGMEQEDSVTVLSNVLASQYALGTEMVGGFLEAEDSTFFRFGIPQSPAIGTEGVVSSSQGYKKEMDSP